MNALLLEDLLRLNEKYKNRIKVRFNQSNEIENPRDLFLSSPDKLNKEWFLWRNKQKYFQVGDIGVCFVKLSDNEWLLTNIALITKDLDVYDAINYEAEELEEYKSLFGRLVVRFKKTTRSQHYNYEFIKDKLEVAELLPDIYKMNDFPGYDRVYLNYEGLCSAINGNNSTWKEALRGQKAVYVITDTCNDSNAFKSKGKIYIGSATSDNGLLYARWKNYADNGTGGNKELEKIKKEKGMEYIKKYFTWSIIENFNSKVDDAFILEREQFWKKVFNSVKCGLNDN